MEPTTPLFCIKVGTIRYTRSDEWGNSPDGLSLSPRDNLKHLALFYTLNLEQLDLHFLLIKISPGLKIQAIVLGHLIAFLLETLNQP